MDLSGRPLLDTKPDRALFAGREPLLERLVGLARQRLNVLVVGERGSGKTSLIRQLAYELRQRYPDEPAPAFVEGGLATDARTFLDLVRYRLGLDPAVLRPSVVETAVTKFAGQPVLDDTLELPRLVASLREADDGTQRVVLIDDLSPSVAQTVFGQLRDEVWQLPITWVIAATDYHAGELMSPPADAFFDVKVDLSPLSDQEQSRLLEARLGTSERQIAREVSEGNPRRLLALAREAIHGEKPIADIARARSKRDAEVAELGRPAAMLMAELESLGPVSASDERLLGRLGWTRSRAVQVLRALEDRGLVTSSMVKGKSGRPRKVYRPIDPEAPASDKEQRPR